MNTMNNLFTNNGFNPKWHKMFKCPYCDDIYYNPISQNGDKMHCARCYNTFSILKNLVNAKEELEKINKKSEEYCEEIRKQREEQRNKMIEYRKLRDYSYDNIQKTTNIGCSLTTVIITVVTSIVIIGSFIVGIIAWIS